jgi:WD40 repeat protein
LKVYLIADADNVIKIWDTDSWQPLTVFSDNKNQINDIAWNDSTNRYAITSGGEIIIVDFDLVAQNCKLAGRNFSWQEWIDIWQHEPYRIVCPQWPVHPSVPPEALPEADS